MRRPSDVIGGGSLDQLALFEHETSRSDWSVRESWRARRLTVRVFPGGAVEIVVPVGTRSRTIQQFVTRHRSWIDRKVLEFRHHLAGPADELPILVDLKATSRQYKVHYCLAGGAPRATEQEGRLIISGDLHRRLLVRHAMHRWLLHAAHQQLLPWLQTVANGYRLSFSRSQVRRQRTRWGSCSRAGTISINACLLFQPAEVVRYLFVHELAHTVHLNHSRRFWALVASMEPQWRELDRELSNGWRNVPPWAIG